MSDTAPPKRGRLTPAQARAARDLEDPGTVLDATILLAEDLSVALADLPAPAAAKALPALRQARAAMLRAEALARG